MMFFWKVVILFFEQNAKQEYYAAVSQIFYKVI